MDGIVITLSITGVISLILTLLSRKRINKFKEKVKGLLTADARSAKCTRKIFQWASKLIAHKVAGVAAEALKESNLDKVVSILENIDL